MWPSCDQTGAQDDLDKVTKMAYSQVVEYGMSPKVGHVSLPIKGSRRYMKTLYSDKLCRIIDQVSGISLLTQCHPLNGGISWCHVTQCDIFM